jgi:hypothetical protein
MVLTELKKVKPWSPSTRRLRGSHAEWTTLNVVLSGA